MEKWTEEEMATNMNKIHNMDCLEFMKKVPDDSVDMVLTSPPYDNLRMYGEISLDDIKAIAIELYRILKRGGVCVWNVGDAVFGGTESLTSFKTAVVFNDLGFSLHDTMIYEKNSSTFPARRDGIRYTQIFEYMFVFSKGIPKTVNLICDKKNKWAGSTDFSGKQGEVPEYSPRTNIWKYTTSFDDKTGHPAIMPLQMAKDHIESWSNINNVILDPFMGSGTTAKACIELGRKFIGSEISELYADNAKKRLQNVQTSMFAFIDDQCE